MLDSYQPSFLCCIDLPAPFHTWNFNDDLGGWNNDNNNWNQKWILDGGAVCLSGKPAAPPPKLPANDPWADVEDSEGDSGPSEIKARLWSRKVPAKFGIQCLTLQFRTSLELASLALLQRQEG